MVESMVVLWRGLAACSRQEGLKRGRRVKRHSALWRKKSNERREQRRGKAERGKAERVKDDWASWELERMANKMSEEKAAEAVRETAVLIL